MTEIERPLAVDIDGTLSRPDSSIDGRILGALRGWAGPVVVATGKALPYPVALAQFIGVEPNVVAENGGVAHAAGEIFYGGDRAGVDDAATELRRRGVDPGWGEADLTNRWRETELAIARDRPLDVLEEVAAAHDLEVVDTGFAYHLKSPDVSKGRALRESVAPALGLDPADFLAVGDSRNDLELFEAVGESVAVANADEHATAAADRVVERSNADGFLEAVELLAEYPPR
jgi:phosphoglycolate phosphatase (TIGR01487 family)